MDDRILKALYEPFKLQERRGVGNKVFKYVPSEDIVDRMNKVFKGSWSTDVRHKEIIEDQILLCVRVWVRDPIDGVEHWHDGYASHPIARYTTGVNNGKAIDIGNSFKSAMSKAIKTAVSKWGVALYLESDDAGDTSFDFGSSFSSPPTKVGETSDNKEMPQGPLGFDIPTSAGSNNQKSSSEKSTPPVFDIPDLGTQPSKPQAQKTENVSASSPFDVFPGPDTGTGPAGNSSPAFQNVENSESSMPDFAVEETGGGEYCTPVQQVAINTIMESQELTFGELLKKALRRDKDLPESLEKLQYTDAVKIIQYGNELSRV